MSILINLFLITSVLIIVKCLERPQRRGTHRRGRTIFHEDQDVLITMIIIWPYYFPLWERFYNTTIEQGTDTALAQFPYIPPAGLSTCTTCRKRRALMQRKGRFAFFQFDEQITYFLIELLAAYPVPIIPNPYATANRKPVREKTGGLFNPLPGLNGLGEVAGLIGNMFGGGSSVGQRPGSFGPIPQGIDNIPVQAPIGLFDRNALRSRSLDLNDIPRVPTEANGMHSSIAQHLSNNSDNNRTKNQRNLCFTPDLNIRSSRSIEENCFLNTKNSHILSAYETVTLDRKEGVATLKLNWSSLFSTVSCHFTEWYLKQVNFFARNFFLGSIKTICSNSRLVLFFTVFQKYCKCLILKKMI